MSEWFSADEGKIRLRFKDCDVLKWDDHPSFLEGLGKVPNTRAVDFVLKTPDDLVVLLELKDFRGHRIENKKKFDPYELPTQVAEKVRDTLAGMLWSCGRDGLRDDVVHRVTKRVSACRREKLLVVLWLDQDRSGHGGEAATLQREIELRLKRHIEARVVVTSLRLREAALPRARYPWLEAESLPKTT